jgi:ribokinase
MKKIAVIGSINMDLVTTVERFPKAGETLIGKDFGTFPGGKGANQAVAAGRLQADVRILGKVGSDSFGEQQLHNLKQNGVTITGVEIEKDVSSGIAVIEVDRDGENRIIVIPGANYRVDREYIDRQLPWLLECDIFLFQLEIPLETVLYCLRKLKQPGRTIILDPAPARSLPEDIYPFIDVITPNETELAILTKSEIKDQNQLCEAGRILLNKGVGTVIVKAGKNGAYMMNQTGLSHIPACQVKTVDTTAAGDSFNAGFAFSLAQGWNMEKCVRFANATGALAVTGKGAQSSMPTFIEVQTFLAGN